MSIFKNKYKRSAWFEGLLECEAEYKSGGRFIEPKEGTLTEWVWLSYGESGQIGVNINQNYQRAKGYLDYINYFNEKLK